MLSIGALARLGNVSVRMLRHWDGVGLLEPVHVDERTGYRSYDPAQLHRLHRIVALRELGFGLDDTATMLGDAVDHERLVALLDERRLVVEREHALAVARLAEVSRRLRIIAKEETMPTEIVIQPLPAVRLVARSALVAESSEIAGAVERMFAQVADDLQHAPGALEVPMAQYDFEDAGIRVTAGYAAEGATPEGVEVVELPAVAQAACAVHLGPMESVPAAWQSMHAVIAERGLVPDGPARERYVRAEVDDQSDWVTELEQPVRSL